MTGSSSAHSARDLMRDIARMREAAADGDYTRAESLARILLQRWPGYSGGMVAWCMYWQLNPVPPAGGDSLDVVRDVLRAASELESIGLDATYELGRFLLAVDDDPQGAREVAIAEIGRLTERLRQFDSLLKEANDELAG